MAGFENLEHVDLVVEQSLSPNKQRRILFICIAVLSLLILIAVCLFVFWPFGAYRSDEFAIPDCFDSVPAFSRSHESYEYLRKPFNTKHLEECYPLAIVLARSEQEVRQALKCAINHSLEVRVRAGGHSYEAESSKGGKKTVILDLRLMDRVILAKRPNDDRSHDFKVQAGATLGRLYDVLAYKNLFVPGGTCPSVGVAGLTGVGGKGPFARRYGLLADSVLQMRMVNGKGEVLVVDDETNADLFWALRGGGLWNFGIVTEIIFRARHYQGNMTFIRIAWDPESPKEGGQLLNLLQNWCPSAPSEISGLYIVMADNRIHLSATFLGGAEKAEEIFSEILNRTQISSNSTEFNEYEAFPMAAIYHHSRGGEYDPDFFRNSGTAETRAASAFGSKSKSEYLNKAMPAEANEQVLKLMNNATYKGWGFWWMIDCMGGVMANQANNLTAYAHRKAKMVMQYQIWEKEDSDNWKQAQEFLDKVQAVFREHASGEHYLGYEDHEMPENDWKEAYYGENYNRLMQVKRKYDRHGVFGHTQHSLVL